jgi:hypothetical protein
MSFCLLMNSCSGGTSSNVSDSGSSDYVARTCPNGSVINALTQICPLTQNQANQLANDYVNNKINSISNSYR